MNNDVHYFEHPFLETNLLILVQLCPKNRKSWTKIKRLDRAILYIQSEFYIE